MTTTSTKKIRVVRDAAFGTRLAQSCDANFHCPAMNFGRLRWIVEQMEARFGEKVSTETVSKWMKGESKPRKGKYERLAQLLGVDEAWLYLGVDPDMTPRERKLRNAEADGVVNVVAGLIQMDGGFPAFPDESDMRAQKEHIDLYAIIRGANYAFHISLAYRLGDHAWQFPVPPYNDQNVLTLGVVRDGFFVRIVELATEDAEFVGAATKITLTDDQVAELAIESFARRL